MKILFNGMHITELEFDESILSNNGAFENLNKLLDRIEKNPQERIDYSTPDDKLNLYEQIYNSVMKEKPISTQEIKSYTRFPNLVQDTAENTKDNFTIDLSKVNIKEPETYSYFRCPHCGQSHFIIVKANGSTMHLVRDIEDKTSPIYEIEEPIDYDEYKYGDAIKVGLKLSIINEESVNGLCPLCIDTNPIKEWIDAYENPHKYFEYDNLCDICGGEMLFDISKSTLNTENPLVCEKCGYSK